MIETAVFGGTFDPIHIEHVSIAKACVEELGVKKLIIVPTVNPPHKEEAGISFPVRAEMLGLAFKDFPCEVVISDIEKERGGKSFAADSLPLLKERYGDFYYIIGGDSLWNFEDWHKPDFIAKNFKVIVFNREGYPDVSDKVRQLNLKWDCNIRVMEYRGKAVDSRTLRTRLDLGLYTAGLPKAVEEYIVRRKLYQNYSGILLRLTAYLSKSRITHSKNTVLAAAYINSRCNLGVSYDKIITSGLLHDIGKKYDYDDKAVLAFDIPKDSLNTPVQHQFVGAVLAQKDFKINDGEILDAIRYHTTGRPAMTVLEKLIYVADMVSDEREFPEVERLRQAVYHDFEKGFMICMLYSYKYLADNKRNIYPLTTQAINYYKEQK